MKTWIVNVALACLVMGSMAAHEHKPPHGGTLVEFGKEYAHLELVADSKDGRLTAYILDGEAENAIRIKQKEIVLQVQTKAPMTRVTLKAVANVLTGEAVGDTSEFLGKFANLAGLKRFSCVIEKVTIKGRDFTDVRFDFPEGNEKDAEKEHNNVKKN